MKNTHLKNKMSASWQQGFAAVEIMVVVVIVGLVGFSGFKVYDAQQQKKSDKLALTQKENQTAKSDKLSSKQEKALQAQAISPDPTAPPTAPGQPSTTTQTKPKAINNSLAGAVVKPVSPASPAPAPAPAPQPVSTITRPTAEFCAQKNGNYFTNVWLTDNSPYTYQGYAWENGYNINGTQVTKTETGTPLRNYDTMQIFDVLPYKSQPQYAGCSQKSGYIMYYYSVPNSPYTFNVLVAFEHVSLTQP